MRSEHADNEKSPDTGDHIDDVDFTANTVSVVNKVNLICRQRPGTRFAIRESLLALGLAIFGFQIPNFYFQISSFSSCRSSIISLLNLHRLDS